MEQRSQAVDSAPPLTRKALRAAQQATQPAQPEVLTRAMLRQQRELELQAQQSAQETPPLTDAIADANDGDTSEIRPPESLESRVAEPAPSVIDPAPSVGEPKARVAGVPPNAVKSDLNIFDQVPTPDVILRDPSESMCQNHAVEAAALSYKAFNTATAVSLPTRSSLRRPAARAQVTPFAPLQVPEHPPVKAKTSRPGKAASRVALLMTLAMATIATPMAMASSPEAGPVADPDFEAEGEQPQIGPTTAQVVASGLDLADVPGGIAQPTALDDRVLHVASRSDIRTVLSGCDPTLRASGLNGQLNTSDLCAIRPGQSLRADAAVAFAALDEAYLARFGEQMCITDSYRSLPTQRVLKVQKGSLAATPGHSNHGWGLALDICNTSWHAAERWDWLNANAPSFGWAQPDWASRSYEPWHWEFTEGVVNK